MNEKAVVFGDESSLVGIAAYPAAGLVPESTGVIFLNAGIVHRVGPGRLYVKLARRLAASGWSSLRFDHSGIGDSNRRRDRLSFDEASVKEAQEAMDWLSRERGCSRFVLVGLCSGTLTAYRTACRDPRVSGLVLMTALLEPPESVSEETIHQAMKRRNARSYVTEKALRLGSWKKLVTGRTSYRRIASAVWSMVLDRLRRRDTLSPGTREVIQRLEEMLGRGVSILFLFGEPTTVLEYFRMTLEPRVDELRRRGDLEVSVVRRSDHTFTSLEHQSRVVDLVTEWIGRTNRARGKDNERRCS